MGGIGSGKVDRSAAIMTVVRFFLHYTFSLPTTTLTWSPGL